MNYLIKKEKEDKQLIKEKKDKCYYIKNIIIPKTNKLFLEKEEEKLNIFDLGKFFCNE